MRPEAEEPGERDLCLGRPVYACKCRERLMAGEAASASRPAEWRMSDDRDAELGAAFDDSAAQRPLVEWADCDLHGCYRREFHGLV